MGEQIYLIRHNGRLDCTRSVKPEPPQKIKPGLKSSMDGDWVMSAGEAARRTALLAPIGSTIELCAAGVKVSAFTVEVVAGPFEIRPAPSDDPARPRMMSRIIVTPSGDIRWSIARATYLLPDGREAGPSVVHALATVLGI